MHLHLIRTALATAALCANFSAAAHESDVEARQRPLQGQLQCRSPA
ncbi:MAG: hypothetical protein IPQ21_22380 [Betaproteobacteria bacterium]|nr:hypothetical protein [Betaproteobacteria bacterium]